MTIDRSDRLTIFDKYYADMKIIDFQRSKCRIIFIMILLQIILFNGIHNFSFAQGWSFTFTLTQTGPCGSSLPTLPQFTIPFFANQSQCESLRQSILNISASMPVYDNQGDIIGYCRVFYTCTACTGSDIQTSSNSNMPGSVSFDGPAQGQAFFSPHESQAIENWINDYIKKMESIGYPVNQNAMFNFQNIPLTGDPAFDQFYFNQLNDFENAKPANVGNKPEVAVSSGEVEISGSTVMLLTTREEIKKRDEWWDEMGFSSPVQVGPDNIIDEDGNVVEGRSIEDAATRTALGKAPGLAGTIADFIVNTVDETFKGITDATKDFTRGNDAAALQKVENLEGKIVFNAAKTTAINKSVDVVLDIGYSPMLKGVKYAEPVHNVISTGMDFWKNLKGN